MITKIRKFNVRTIVAKINEIIERVNVIDAMTGDGMVNVSGHTSKRLHMNVDILRSRIRGGQNSSTGGVQVYKAYCSEDAGTGSSIECWKSYDCSSASAWAADTSYLVDDIVSYSGVYYSCSTDHTSTSEDGPGTDAGQTYWNEVEDITVECALFDESDLNACAPLLEIGSLTFVIQDGDTWRSLYAYNGTEECS